MEENERVDLKLGLIAKSSVIVFVGLFLSKLITYFYKIIIGRSYGPESYGLFSLAIMVLGIFVAVSSLGFTEGLNRFLPIYLSKKEDKKFLYLIGVCKNIFIFSSILSAILLFIFSNFISEFFFHTVELSIYLKIFAFVIPLQLFSQFYFSVIRANEKIGAYSFGVNILQNIPKMIFIIVFAIFGVRASFSISFSYLLGIFAMLIFGYIYSRGLVASSVGASEKRLLATSDRLQAKTHNSNRAILREVFSYSWPLFLFSVVGSLVFWVDNFAIGFLKDAYWVGIYNSAIPIATLLLITSEIFMQLFFPIITKEINRGNFYVSSELTKQVFKWIFAINLPLVSFIILFPGVFINFFWGAEYLIAQNSLIFLAIGYFVFSLAIVSNNILSSVGKSKTLLANLGIISILNLTLNFMLVPIYGIDGAAFATMISLIVWSTLLIIEAKYFSKIFPFRRKMINVLFSAGITTGFLFFFTEYFKFGVIGLILFAIIYAIVYFAMLILTRALDENDWKILKKVGGR